MTQGQTDQTDNCRMDSQATFDVVVVGGGLSGTCAAIAAAREGSRVLLIERYGFLGGMATAGLVNPFTPYCLWREDGRLDWNHLVNAGLFQQITERLRSMNGLADDNVTFNEELLKILLDRMCAEQGVKVWLHSMVVGCRNSGARVESVHVATRSGLRTLRARAFIDATGDGDLAAFAGCDFVVGNEDTGLSQPMTLCFRIANVDAQRFRAGLDLGKFENNMSAGEIDEKYRIARKLGRIEKNPRDSLVVLNHMLESVVHLNSTRVAGRVSVRGDDLSEAEVEGREQAYELYRFLRHEIPGFEDSYLLMSGTQIGVRESRRIVGVATLTAGEIMSCRKFDDAIARGTWHVELHDPAGEGTLIRRIPPGDYYTVPFRALCPSGRDNLLVVGRTVSATQEAHSAIRVMPICASIGEAAGVAAGLLGDRSGIADLAVAQIQKQLERHGGLY